MLEFQQFIILYMKDHGVSKDSYIQGSLIWNNTIDLDYLEKCADVFMDRYLK